MAFYLAIFSGRETTLDFVTRYIWVLVLKLNINNFRRFLIFLAQFFGHQLSLSDMGRALEARVSANDQRLPGHHSPGISLEKPAAFC